MTSKRPASFACSFFLAASLLCAVPAQAVVDSAKVAINTGGPGFIESTVVLTMSLVTSPLEGKKSYIEIFFLTDTEQLGLRLYSKDQRRVEAFYNQMVIATSSHQEFQITAYSSGMFQSNGYEASLDSNLTYFILY